MTRQRVRAVVVGDQGVGKSSMIIATCSNIVREDTPSVLPETNLSHLVPERDVTFTCLDSSSHPTLLGETRTAVATANVVLVCFACNVLSTLENAIGLWLNRVKNWNSHAPVILVACKEDLQEPTPEQRAVLDRASRVEASILGICSCSALTQATVIGVFVRACNAVLFPLRPLFDHVRVRLRSRAKKAFKRIFQLCDLDGDGALSDQELTHLQLLSFGAPFEPGELEQLKQMVMQLAPNGVTTAGLTLEGFVHLQTLTIMRERLDICWAMLERFGFNREVEISEALVQDAPPRMSTDLVAQLSVEAVAFLGAAFDARCSPAGTLPLAALLTHGSDADSLLQNAPGPRPPLEERLLRGCSVPTAGDGGLPRDSFLALWAYCTLVDPRQAVKAMLYMGYRDNMLSKAGGIVGATAVKNLLCIVPRRSLTADLLHPPGAPPPGLHIFNCLVFGSRDCGKSSLLRRLVARGAVPLPPLPESQSGTNTAAALIEPPPPDSSPDAPPPPTVLVLIEVPEKDALAIVMDPSVRPERRARLASNHAAFFCFDCRSAESLERAKTFLVAVSDLTNNAVPVALVTCKADLGMTSAAAAQVQAVCDELELPPALESPALQADSSGLLHAMVAVAANPRKHLATTPLLAAARQQRELIWRLVKVTGLVSTAVLSASLLAYWSYHLHRAHAERGASKKGAASSSRVTQPARLPNQGLVHSAREGGAEGASQVGGLSSAATTSIVPSSAAMLADFGAWARGWFIRPGSDA